MSRNFHYYTQEEIQFIKDNVKGISTFELQERFNKKFNANVSHDSICNIKYRYHLKNGLRNACKRGTPFKWEKEHIDFLRENVKGTSVPDLTKMFNEKFNTNVSEEAISNQKYKYQLKSGYSGTHFVKGYKSFKKKPVGTLTKWDGGHGDIYIKVADPNTWRPYKRVLYEQYHNVKLDRQDCIVFLDGDKENFDINNLKRISHSENSYMARNGGANYTKEINQAYICMAKIKNKISKLSKAGD